jgi:NADH-quinone oxidoreductase subunit E
VSDLIHLTDGRERPRAPRADELELKFSTEAIKQLEQIISHYPQKKAATLPALWIAQREYGGSLPPEAIAETALRLGQSYAEVEGVATFYSMYNTDHAVGRHMIEVCTCLSCHMCGAYRIADKLKEKLGVDFGETTADGMFTLHEVECLNACDRAPLIQVGDEYHGPMDDASLDKLIEDLRARTESSSVKLADTVVQVHLMATEKA